MSKLGLRCLKHDDENCCYCALMEAPFQYQQENRLIVFQEAPTEWLVLEWHSKGSIMVKCERCLVCEVIDMPKVLSSVLQFMLKCSQAHASCKPLHVRELAQRVPQPKSKHSKKRKPLPKPQLTKKDINKCLKDADKIVKEVMSKHRPKDRM